MVNSHEKIQEAQSNAVFESIKGTFSLGVEEMKRMIIGTVNSPEISKNVATTDKRVFQKWQITPELDKREDAVAKMRSQHAN